MRILGIGFFLLFLAAAPLLASHSGVCATVISSDLEGLDHTAENALVDPGAADKLGRFLLKKIPNILYSLRAPRSEIPDLSQSTILRILKNLGNYEKEKGPFFAWAISIARRQLQDYFRGLNRKKRKLNRFFEGGQENEIPSREDSDSGKKDEINLVLILVEDLPQNSKEIIRAYLEANGNKALAARNLKKNAITYFFALRKTLETLRTLLEQKNN